jgi:hypothetical protein
MQTQHAKQKKHGRRPNKKLSAAKEKNVSDQKNKNKKTQM